MKIQQRNNIISIFLILIIIALSYVLFDSIVTPWQKEMAKRKLTDDTRFRMTLVRDALINFQARHPEGKFPSTLDSLVIFLKTDSLMQVRGADLFTEPVRGYQPDSLIYSLRPPHEKFVYSVNDTIRPPLYLLKDPGSDDAIGSLERITLLNAPNWQ
jgi:hypothetical protein